MDHQAVLESAKQSISEAISLDNSGEYDKAYNKYQRALEQFIVYLKYEKNEATKKTLMKKIEEYMNRAEVLKKTLSEKNKPVLADGSLAAKEKEDENIKFKASLSEAIISEKPNVKWSDVAGLDLAKQALKEAVILPVKFPQLFTGKRKPWKGILLYGPPGTGKSFLAKAVATEADSVFFSVSSADLVSKWQGESEKLVRALFNMAREKTPAIVFIDEIDSLCGVRGEGENEASRRIKTEFLVQMQGVGKGNDGVLVLGATNIPWTLDPAMRRRFEKRIYIPLPDFDARLIMFKLNIGKTATNLSEENFQELAKISDGFSGADISVVVREALMIPVRKLNDARFFKIDSEGFYEPVFDYPPCPFCPMKLSADGDSANGKACSVCKSIRMTLFEIPKNMVREPKISFSDFQTALKNTNASVSPSELKHFDEWTMQFGQEG